MQDLPKTVNIDIMHRSTLKKINRNSKINNIELGKTQFVSCKRKHTHAVSYIGIIVILYIILLQSTNTVNGLPDNTNQKPVSNKSQQENASEHEANNKEDDGKTTGSHKSGNSQIGHLTGFLCDLTMAFIHCCKYQLLV